MHDQFQDKIFVITGSSRGIGLAVASAFLSRGATVVGVARTASGHSHDRYHPIDFDLGAASAAQIRTLVEGIIAKHGRIDGLINNAGIIRRSPAVDYTEQDWDDVLRVNLTTPFFLMQAVARWWLNGGRQAAATRLKIVNIASLLSFQGGILVPAYAASKHGIGGLTKALANEWAAAAINVNAVAPGYVETENTAALRADSARNTAILGRIPQGEWAQPNSIAGACIYLASQEADYVNGAILNVDGGWLGR